MKRTHKKMTSYMGPEKPEPQSIVSELDMKLRLTSILDANESKVSSRQMTGYFSGMDQMIVEDNQNQLCERIDKYIDLECSDRILYVRPRGESDESSSHVKDWPGLFEHRYSLIHPVDVGELTALSDNLEYKKKTSEKYDKILIKNCLVFFDQDPKEFCRFLLNLLVEPIQAKTCVLVIQRLSDLSTLPFYKSINDEWLSSDVKYAKIMHSMQAEYFVLNHGIELFKHLIDCKSDWYSRLSKRDIYPLFRPNLIEKNKREELEMGVRELNEGFFKYQPFDDHVEITDRLLFIGLYPNLKK